MARMRMPDAIQRREILEQKLDPAKASTYAETYLEQDRVFEALAFLDKAGELDRVRTIRDEAIRAGDVFLLREAAARCGEEPEADTWRALAEAAAAAGKDAYAQEARRQLAAREAS